MSKDEKELHLAIEHSKEAIDIFDDHFDVHLILAQSYSTKYFLTQNEKFKQQALAEYKRSKELTSKRPGIDPKILEDRIKELIFELFC